MIIQRKPEGHILSVENPKVAVFSCPFEAATGETKSTVAIKNAEDLINFTKGEEDNMEVLVKGLADAGVNCVICGGSYSELAMHFLDKYEIMFIKIQSKFELKRIAKSLNASMCSRLGTPTNEEMSSCKSISTITIGERVVIKLVQ